MGRGRKSPLIIKLTKEEEDKLEKWQRSTTIAAGLARRGEIILLKAKGVSLIDISKRVCIQRCVVRKWTTRFIEKRIDGLYDKTGRGAKPFFSTRSCSSLGKNSM